MLSDIYHSFKIYVNYYRSSLLYRPVEQFSKSRILASACKWTWPEYINRFSQSFIQYFKAFVTSCYFLLPFFNKVLHNLSFNKRLVSCKRRGTHGKSSWKLRLSNFLNNLMGLFFKFLGVIMQKKSLKSTTVKSGNQVIQRFLDPAGVVYTNHVDDLTVTSLITISRIFFMTSCLWRKKFSEKCSQRFAEFLEAILQLWNDNCFRGRPFDSEGGWQFRSGQNIYFPATTGQNIYFQHD